jgi:hypothetical protein
VASPLQGSGFERETPEEGFNGVELAAPEPANHTVEPSVGARFDLFED